MHWHLCLLYYIYITKMWMIYKQQWIDKKHLIDKKLLINLFTYKNWLNKVANHALNICKSQV